MKKFKAILICWIASFLLLKAMNTNMLNSYGTMDDIEVQKNELHQVPFVINNYSEINLHIVFSCFMKLTAEHTLKLL